MVLPILVNCFGIHVTCAINFGNVGVVFNHCPFTSSRECSPIPLDCGDVTPGVKGGHAINPLQPEPRSKVEDKSRSAAGDDLSSIRKCVCDDALLTTGERYVQRCDPLNPGGYLVCLTGADPAVLKCAAGTKWNSVERACASTAQCLPVPPRCRGARSPSNPSTPTTAPSCPLKYTLHKKKLDWHTARLVCEANESELAVILTNETQAYLTETYGSDKKKSYGGIWIGASDGGEEGTWRWVTGPVGFFCHQFRPFRLGMIMLKY